MVGNDRERMEFLCLISGFIPGLCRHDVVSLEPATKPMNRDLVLIKDNQAGLAQEMTCHSGG